MIHERQRRRLPSTCSVDVARSLPDHRAEENQQQQHDHGRIREPRPPHAHARLLVEDLANRRGAVCGVAVGADVDRQRLGDVFEGRPVAFKVDVAEVEECLRDGGAAEGISICVDGNVEKGVKGLV